MAAPGRPAPRSRRCRKGSRRSCAPRAKTESSSWRRCSRWCPDAAANRSSAPHLKSLRPFLKAGDFAPGSWGQELIDPLAPADVTVEKIAYSAFHASRLEWVLRKCGIEHLYFTGIVTNGGVASTVRDAHVREFHCTVIADGCAAFSPEVHSAAIEGLQACRESDHSGGCDGGVRRAMMRP